jgi:hypothetical protein
MVGTCDLRFVQFTFCQVDFCKVDSQFATSPNPGTVLDSVADGVNAEGVKGVISQVRYSFDKLLPDTDRLYRRFGIRPKAVFYTKTINDRSPAIEVQKF